MKKIIEFIKSEIGCYISTNWRDTLIMFLYILVFIGITILSILCFGVSSILTILFTPLVLFKKIFGNRIWFQNFSLWFRTYLEYKWNCMPNYNIDKVRHIRKSGFRNATQKTLNRWAYWVYKNHRRNENN